MTRGIIAAVFTAWLAVASVRAQEAGPPPLFASDELLHLTLRADLALLKGDRDEETPERPATVTIGAADGTEHTLDAQLRTRGIFRKARANCSFPPLRLNLKKKQAEGTVFEGQDKLKMVGSCRPNRSSYEQLVLQEYLAYRSFALISRTAFKVRLARVTYIDESGEDEPSTRFAFFVEDDDAMAARLGAQVLDLPEGRHLPPGVLDPPTAATMAVFQYMIGNTDWSDAAAHNVELLDLMGIGLAVPYDFDFAGIVDAPYATPDPSLNLGSVRDRMFRGWCWSNLDIDPVLETFRSVQEEVLELYASFPHLEDGERSRALRYLGAFFDDIESTQRAHRRFLRDCRRMPQRQASRN
jgi:hypothetical protein